MPASSRTSRDRLDVDQHARRDGLAQLDSRLARAGEADLVPDRHPASSATFSSPAEATSMPSTSPRHEATSAGIGLAFIA